MTEKINDWMGVIEKVNIHYQIAEFILPCINIRVKCIDLETYNKLKKILREFSEEEWGRENFVSEKRSEINDMGNNL